MKVELKPWKPELDPRVPDGVNAFFRSYLYFARRRIFNRHTLWIALAGAGVLTFLLSAEHRRDALVFVCAQALFTLYLYLRAAKLASNLHIRWLSAGEGSAGLGDTVTVKFVVESTSAFGAPAICALDSFPAAEASQVRFVVTPELEPFGRVQASYRRKLDSGMGEYGLGPLKLILGDPLGLFEFVITDERPRRLAVYPRAEAVEGIGIHGSRESFQFGIHDVPVHGASACFMGVREYARGDGLRQIAWRLSARSSKLLVKDFEKSVNADVTLLLNMCAREHMGNRAHSTWEVAKDAALGVLRQQIEEGNSVQLLSNGISIPFGRGSEHAQLITHRIFRALPEAAGDSARLLDALVPLVPSSSTLIYVSPLFAKETDAVVDRLAELRERNVEIICLAIDAPSFMHDRAHGSVKAVIEAELARATRTAEETASRLAKSGIRVYWLARDRSIAAQILAQSKRELATL